VGRVPRDPELKQTASGQTVCSLGLATNREALESITPNTVAIAQVEGENVIERSVEDIQNIVNANKEKVGVAEEEKTEETGEQSQPENETVGEAAAGESSEDLKAEESTEGQPEGQETATEGQESNETTGDPKTIAEGEAVGEANPAQSVE